MTELPTYSDTDFIQLYSGRAFYFLNPTVDMIDIDDIAHTLSLLCRFGGHCKEFYSVAEHSVRCSWNAPVEHKLEALLHDGAEAYLVDMPRPIKLCLPEYKVLDVGIDKVVREKFGLPDKMTPEVHLIDNRMLATEKRDLMKPSDREWLALPDPYEDTIEPWTPGVAQEMFLAEYEILTS